tara:strand:+ start:3530 stop:3772 length:243 start_codon:yes stop_codon:yes gene_type:complete
MSISNWFSKTRIALEDGDAAIVLKSDGRTTLYTPKDVPEDGDEIGLENPLFRLTIFCWLFEEEQKHIVDEFLESVAEDED